MKPMCEEQINTDYPSADVIFKAAKSEYEQNEELRKEYDQRTTALLAFCGVAIGALLATVKAADSHIPFAVILILLVAVFIFAVASFRFAQVLSCRRFDRINLAALMREDIIQAPVSETKSNLASTYLSVIQQNQEPMNSKVSYLTRGIRCIQGAVFAVVVGLIIWAVLPAAQVGKPVAQDTSSVKQEVISSTSATGMQVTQTIRMIREEPHTDSAIKSSTKPEEDIITNATAKKRSTTATSTK